MTSLQQSLIIGRQLASSCPRERQRHHSQDSCPFCFSSPIPAPLSLLKLTFQNRSSVSPLTENKQHSCEAKELPIEVLGGARVVCLAFLSLLPKPEPLQREGGSIHSERGDRRLHYSHALLYLPSKYRWLCLCQSRAPICSHT